MNQNSPNDGEPKPVIRIAPEHTELNNTPSRISTWVILLAGFAGAVFGVGVGTMATAQVVRGLLPLGDTAAANATPAASSEILTLTPSKDPVVDAAHRVAPSIVNIRTSFKGADRFHDGGDVKGQGSGVIFKSDGFILTNAHVVEGAKNIYVTLPSGKDVRGSLIGLDAENDIAVVKVPAKGLPTATFGNSKELRVGELAVAVGSPFGLEHTVTSGVISALHRNVSADDETRLKTLTDLIQTDAPINPGNSGGALANHEGKVIGINTLIFTTNGSGQGIGFAIPAEFALRLGKELIASGKTSHPYIGVCVDNLDEALAKELKADATKGAVITRILPKSPAGLAGLKRNDVVVRAGKVEVTSAEDLIAAVRGENIGRTIRLSIFRKGKPSSILVRLARKPSDSEVGCAALSDVPGKESSPEEEPPGHP